jgi:protein-L-isoaspartate(D-aspartate) O-methyltransferase
MTLINYLISSGYLKTPLIIDAFLKIKRVDFLPDNIKNLSELNEALPIAEGQTISQPAVVAFMLELLYPKPGDKILDIGSGSGWTTSLLSYIVSKGGENKQGKVFAIEVIEKLKIFGEQNTNKYNFIEKGTTTFLCSDGTKGLEKEAPFDKILISATAEKIPPKLKQQLKIGGRLVLPLKDENSNTFSSQSIYLVKKKNKKEFETEKYPGFVFVPLIEN